jgi:hypothetical protein
MMAKQKRSDETQETTVELITFGALVILFALFLLTNITDSLAMTAGGLILLASGFYQSRRGWHVSLTTWLLAGVLLAGGIGVRVFLVSYLRINWVAIALLLIGGFVIWDRLRGRRG